MSRPDAFRCLRCGAVRAVDVRVPGCEHCRGALASNVRVQYAPADVRGWDFQAAFSSRRRGMRRFSPMLPVEEDALVTLCEGDTPLHRAGRLGAYLGLDDLHIKDESRNPTQSYKDRLSAVAVSYAKALGAPVVATASSGNAGASLAAYAARAGLPCVVASMKGASGPMVAQIRKLGAHLILMEDKTRRWPLLAQAVKDHGWFVASPYSAPVLGSTPIGIEGYKTIAYEIFEELGRVPDWLALPVCYGDALAGIHQGFLDLRAAGLADRSPRFIAAEAHGSLAHAMATSADHVDAVPADPASLAASVGAPQSSYQALQALRETHGMAVRIGNEGLVALQELVGAIEGLCLELASVMPFAAVRRLRQDGTVKRGDLVVCLATASGLKDLDKSTLDWKDVPVTGAPQEHVLESARAAAVAASSKLSHLTSGVSP